MTITATIDWNAKVNETLERAAHYGVGGCHTSYLLRPARMGTEISNL